LQWVDARAVVFFSRPTPPLLSPSGGPDGYAIVRLPSGAQRRVLASCRATVGALSNAGHKNRALGKAGASRWAGRRPKVRGVAMNSVDHPMGGGRGKSKGRISQSPTGVPAKGKKTRPRTSRTDVFVHAARPRARK
jgi:large subunit ribosomal protein L2